jgi:transcription-repair coupling factor (superfamily II helicase)
MFEKVLGNEQLLAAARMLEGLGGGASGTGTKARADVVKISGVWGSSAALVAAAIGRLSGRPVLFVTAHLDEADEIADDFEVFTGQAAMQFPAWELDIGTQHVNDEVAGERIRICNELERAGFGCRDSGFGKELAANHANAPKPNRKFLASRNSLPAPPPKPETRNPKPEFLVASIMSLLQPVPTAQALAASRLTLVGGMEMGPEELAGWLVDAGFEHVEQVDGQGEFARRGGIIDILPLGVTQAVRVEFFGDQVESIRKFDLDTQRSTEQVESYDVSSARFGAAGVGGTRRGGPVSSSVRGSREQGGETHGRDAHATEDHGQDAHATTTLLSYLAPETIIIMREPADVRELAQEIYRRTHEDDRSPTFERPATFEDVPEGTAVPEAISMRPAEEIFANFDSFALVEMHSFSPKHDLAERLVDLGIRSLERLSVNTHEALVELAELSRVAQIIVYCQTPAEENRFVELLQTSNLGLAAQRSTDMEAPPQRAGSVQSQIRTDDGANQPGTANNSTRTEDTPARIPNRSEAEICTDGGIRQGAAPDRTAADSAAVAPGTVQLAIGHVHGGFYWPGQKLVVVGHHEIFHRYARVRRIRRLRTGRPIESLLDLRQLERDGKSEEYLTLRFADNALLHVPSSKINLVQKYIGSGLHRPSLSKLGGSGWLHTKERAAEAVHDLAAEMIRIQAMREAMPGVSYPGGTEWQKQFWAEFPYSETEDQTSAMQQLDRDMAATNPMDRLLCGDVGYGKTELAMRAAFRVAEAGKQVAVLVPTTVLAQQHYRTFSERFADYPFTIDVISRFRTAGEQRELLAKLSLGKIDILIGTHRILSKDVHFKDLGLVVVDEEQRFGVEHKERLKEMRATVDVLTMTATPIPRTLHMALLGLRDISSLTTPPLDRRAIHTEVCDYDDKLIRQAILRELNRQGQVFFVHNRVGSIRSVTEHIRKLVPEARVEFGHGQMDKGDLERVMLKLVNDKLDVLVCTTIIESGLDIATANTIIIHKADRFGLSELHQLRGRVGRYKHKAFCYLLLPEDRPVTPVAAKRLKAIEDFSDLGAGFQIAMRDLEIRGAGNILGPQQSGHIAAVGYELYCQLLDKTVRELRGEPIPKRREVHVDLGLDVYIPKSYIPAERQRMEVYRRLVQCGDVKELQSLAAGLADAYGPLPSQAQTVVDLAEIGLLAGTVGVESIIKMDPDIIFAVRDMKAAKRIFAPTGVRTDEGAIGTARLPDASTVHWRLPQAYREMPTLVNVMLKRLRQAAGTV